MGSRDEFIFYHLHMSWSHDETLADPGGLKNIKISYAMSTGSICFLKCYILFVTKSIDYISPPE